MTSTYLPPRPFFFGPPFLAPAGPIKSSMLLALLIEVAGRLGGPDGGPPVASAARTGSAGASPVLPGVPPLDGGPDGGPPEAATLATRLGGPAPTGGLAAIDEAIGGPDVALKPVGGTPSALGGGVPLALLPIPRGPFGGGGVDAAGVAC